MAKLTPLQIADAQFAAAEERGRLYRATQPHATSARYDEESRRIVIELTNGGTFTFPTSLVEGLADAAPEHLAKVELLGAGSALHWETLDVDYSVPGLVNGLFGTRRWLAARAAKTARATRAKRI